MHAKAENGAGPLKALSTGGKMAHYRHKGLSFSGGNLEM